METTNTLYTSQIIDLSKDFDKIYIMYFSRMVRFSKEFSLSYEDAENIVQDTFSAIWEKRGILEIQTSLSTYLYSLVKNRCIDYLRHQLITERYKQELTLKLEALEMLNNEIQTDFDLEKIINDEIAKLPPKCREIFIKSRFEEKKNKEIAEELNISISTVETQMNIALKRLRIALKDFLPIMTLFTMLNNV